jgi:riboflavin synthase
MFTGIIETTACVATAKARHKGVRVGIEKPRGWKLSIGQSISIDGVCSTVVEQSPRTFQVDYMPETILKTTAGALRPGSVVHLERSLVYGARIEGHIVQGHVDAHAEVIAVEQQGSSRLVSIRIPPTLRRFVALHGSITLCGVSLTVARLSGAKCSVALIPHTLESTNLDAIKKGSSVNIEVDYFARYGIATKSPGGTVRRNAAKRVQKGTRSR